MPIRAFVRCMYSGDRVDALVHVRSRTLFWLISMLDQFLMLLGCEFPFKITEISNSRNIVIVEMIDFIVYGHNNDSQ